MSANEHDELVRQIADDIARDWTIDPNSHRSNSHPLFVYLVQQIECLIRTSAHDLIAGRTDTVAGLILAHLAHKYGLVPTDKTYKMYEERDA